MEKHILCKKFSEIELLLIRTGKDILDLDLEDFSSNSDDYKELLIFLDKKITKSMIRKILLFKEKENSRSVPEKSIPSIKFLYINCFISTRTYGCLKRNKIENLEDIASYGIEKLSDLRNFGSKSLKEIINLFQESQFNKIEKKFNADPSEDLKNIKDFKNQKIYNNIRRCALYRNEYLKLGTYQKVGDKYGLSRERIRQIINQGEDLDLYDYNS